ncbi:hypothetical protein [Paenibacillus turpanensis]|uniref:hypothetical protein n=1 Tax=Paenibacillus turpanensis TaxID=2689078 RepID=UPI00140DF7FF|nr:hypothetical protein [Paenibacillus turpanensis]
MEADLKQQVAVFMDSVRDDWSEVDRTLAFLFKLQRTRSEVPPPLAELIGVMKQEKPFLYTMVKNRVVHQPQLRMLFELSLDYQLAKQRLDVFKESISN